MNRSVALALSTFACAAAVVPIWLSLEAQPSAEYSEAADARAALISAREQQRNARSRAERLEKQATTSELAADKAMKEAAALAARVQQAEAGIAASEAELEIVARQRRALDRTLAQRREPLVRLSAALQTMARRPMTLSALQPGSLKDLVHTRAVIASTVPVVRSRTEALRGQVDKARKLEEDRRTALTDLREAEQTLDQRRRAMLAMAQKERITAQRAAGGASREAQRALVLSEASRDLDLLVGKLEKAGALREKLAALPGPVPRPSRPEDAQLAAAAPSPSPNATAPSSAYQLPVAGRVVAGFGTAARAGTRTSGLAIAPRPGAQIVAPGQGRVAFAGPYEGYGQIVIIEHDGGWISLITGLDAVTIAVGQQVTTGSPLGRAAKGRPVVTLELRKDGTPVNPLDHVN